MKINKELLERNIEKIVKYDFDNNKIFGAAYYVMQDGETVYRRCFGKLSVGDAEPVRCDTLFRLASMTKPITAVAALMLVDRGLLSLSDEVSKYLPEFSGIHIKTADDEGNITDLGPAKNAVTVRDLLTHTAAIGVSEKKSNLMTAEDKASIDNSIAFYVRTGLDYEPFDHASYSGTGAFDVMAKIVEIVSGTDFLSFLKNEIFEPCNMKDTTFTPSDEQLGRLIDMHDRIDGECVVGKTYENCIFLDYPCEHYLAGAGLVSTLDDYSEFVKMLLNKGLGSRGRVISEQTFELLSTPYVYKERYECWGLAVRVMSGEEHPLFPEGTFGWSGAFGSHFWIDPTNKVGAIYMKNSHFDGGGAGQSARNFERAVGAAMRNQECDI